MNAFSHWIKWGNHKEPEKTFQFFKKIYEISSCWSQTLCRLSSSESRLYFGVVTQLDIIPHIYRILNVTGTICNRENYADEFIIRLEERQLDIVLKFHIKGQVESINENSVRAEVTKQWINEWSETQRNIPQCTTRYQWREINESAAAKTWKYEWITPSIQLSFHFEKYTISLLNAI